MKLDLKHVPLLASRNLWRSKCAPKSILSKNETVIFIIIVIISIFIGTANPAFWGISTVFNTARAMLIMLMFAMCEMLVIISGGIDVSFPAIATLAMYGTTLFMTKFGIDNIFFAFLMGAGIGILCGLLNAVLTTTFGIPALIATLGTSSFLNGGMLTLLGSRELTVIPDSMERFYKMELLRRELPDGTVSTLTPLILIPVLLCILFYFMLKYTMFGRAVYAVGGDPVAAKRVGFRVTAVKYKVYMLSGLIVGVTGIVYTILMRLANATNLMGTEMMVIAAVVIGGVRITGGKGSVLGVVLGVLLINLVSNHLIMIGIPNYWQKFVIGVIIVLGTAMTSIRDKRIANSPKI